MSLAFCSFRVHLVINKTSTNNDFVVQFCNSMTGRIRNQNVNLVRMETDHKDHFFSFSFGIPSLGKWSHLLQ